MLLLAMYRKFDYYHHGRHLKSAAKMARGQRIASLDGLHNCVDCADDKTQQWQAAGGSQQAAPRAALSRLDDNEVNA